MEPSYGQYILLHNDVIAPRIAKYTPDDIMKVAQFLINKNLLNFSSQFITRSNRTEMTKNEFYEFMGEVFADVTVNDRKKCADDWWRKLAGKAKVIKSNNFNNICNNNHIYMYFLISCMNSTV